MNRVLGIGGIFIKAKDPAVMKAWYRLHLGMDIQEWGGTTFDWPSPDRPTEKGTTAWSLFPQDSKYFDPSTAPFMVNYRVENLDALISALRAEGCQVDEKTDSSEYGKFGWVMDPEGNRIELWEPPAS
jgi:predicted enzyme related to lactoylglutathione lyase